MSSQPTYRCYYDDGTIVMSATECPATTEQGSPLLKSELTLIDDVLGSIQWPWLLLILGLIVLTSKERK
jgi:hypothetical protein